MHQPMLRRHTNQDPSPPGPAVTPTRRQSAPRSPNPPPDQPRNSAAARLATYVRRHRHPQQRRMPPPEKQHPRVTNTPSRPRPQPQRRTPQETHPQGTPRCPRPILPPHANNKKISLLLKKGKDPLDCSSYRPISLIPCDLKIYAKVFASRLEKVIHSLIKEDQTGFIKGRNASDNMRRLLHILDFADSHPTSVRSFHLMQKKAFDRLEWNYMWAVLQCFGFGEHFVSMIKTLYHSPAASVITGNIISPSFPLQRGTRQGCPLSPLLFCLSLEPLAQAIRKSEVSIKIHDHNHSISLYADDIILYLDHFDVFSL